MNIYSDLGVVHRCDPCQEYPGEWLLYLPLPYEGKTEHSFASKDEAMKAGSLITDAWEHERLEYDPRDVKIAWKCSDNDPRQGQVWFTGFYIACRMTIFGWHFRRNT